MLNGLTSPFRWVIFAALLAFAVCLPWLVQPYLLRVLCLILVTAVAATGLNVILGYTGLLCFGHAAVFGVGAYTTARLMLDTGLPLGVVAIVAVVGSAAVGMLVGLASWRVGGDYLALVTLGAGQIFYLFLNNAKEITGGATGLPGIPVGNLFGWQLLSVGSVYVLCLGSALAVTLLARAVGRSFLGRALLAVREDEIVARAHGINVPLTKVASFGIGSGIAGLAGVLQVLLLGFIAPPTFNISQSILLVEIVLIGGMATTAGPLLGSALVIGSTEYLRGLADYRPMIFGALILVVLLWRPGGLSQILGLADRALVTSNRRRLSRWRLPRLVARTEA